MAEVTTFGTWLKRRRAALGLTQEQLAQQVGCSTIALRKIEAEERRPSDLLCFLGYSSTRRDNNG